MAIKQFIKADHYRRLVVILLCVSLGGLFVRGPQRQATAASLNLAWAPYLQQLTDSSVIILWTTQIGATSLVRYSTDTSYSSAADGNARMFSALGVQLHRVALSGLQPNTTYYYKIYTDDQDLLPDQTLSFRTAPSVGSADPFTFLAFGDYGIPSGSQRRLRDQMLRDSFGFILSTGDNAYPDANYTDFDTAVFQVYRDIFSKAAIFPTLGNREYITNSGAPYLDLFDLPTNAWRSDDQERYYSFDYGNAHVVALDANTPLDADDSAADNDMFDWLRSDLSHTTQRWKIVAFHHPAYSSGPHGSDPRVQAKLVPIFEAYGVNLVLNGHDHTYQRSWPLRGGQVTTEAAGGIVYIVSGAGAAASSACGSADWLAFTRCSAAYGLYTRVTVAGDSLTVEAVNDTGAVEDRYTLGKPLISPTPTSTDTPLPTPAATTYAVDTFSRVVTGGWGSAEVGGAYTPASDGASFGVNGSMGTISLAANGLRSAYLSNVSARDVDISFRVQMDKPATNGGQIAYSVARRNSGSAYLCRLRMASDGSVRLQAVREVSGNVSLLGTEKVIIGLNQNMNASIWLRTELFGGDPTTIRLKAWADGQPEPSDWQYSVIDSEPSLQTAGAVGLRVYLSAVASAPVQFSFDDFRVTSAVVPSPGSTFVETAVSTPLALPTPTDMSAKTRYDDVLAALPTASPSPALTQLP